MCFYNYHTNCYSIFFIDFEYLYNRIWCRCATFYVLSVTSEKKNEKVKSKFKSASLRFFSICIRKYVNLHNNGIKYMSYTYYVYVYDILYIFWTNLL